MEPANQTPFRDSLYRLSHVGTTTGVQLVRTVSLQGGNRYEARPVEFDAEGNTVTAGDETLTVVNLAEPADEDGSLPADLDAVAIDVEGRWVVFVRPASSGAIPGKVVASLGGSAYTVREQSPAEPMGFCDKPGSREIEASNLAEMSLGPGAAVDVGTIVLVTAIGAGRYVFDHPVYAKYLE